MTLPYIKIGHHTIQNPAHIKTIDDFRREADVNEDPNEMYQTYIKQCIRTYEGSIYKFNFNEHEYRTFERIQDILLSINKPLLFINAQIITQKHKKTSRIIKNFVAYNANKTFYWVKTSENTLGEEINHVYINGNRFKLANFFCDPNIQSMIYA